ncbi:MAG: hypothetical protein KIT24_05435 [Phycisphaeraceae bacterium]|nr:hypothetical protein [Phycisphaeraceae bacterium]
MKPSRRSHRPYARPGRRDRGVERGSAAGRLASLAGVSRSTLVERLEPRQLLFSLTITPDVVNPATGLGTVGAIFGYTIPYLATEQLVRDPGDPSATTENFADRPAGNVASNFEFDDSFLRVRHNILPASDFRIVVDLDPDGQPIQGSERLRVRLGDVGEFFSFEFDTGDVVTVDDPDALLSQVSLNFNRAGGQFGLNYNNVRAVLTFRGQTVASITGNALRNLNTAPINSADWLAGVGTFVFTAQTPQIPERFDRIRFEAIEGSTEFFDVDDVTGVKPEPIFVDIVTSRIFGAEIRLTGPVGAQVQVFDLYGRPMIPTLALGIPPNSSFALVDPDDNGIPNFNDGIGRIVLTGVDQQSSLTLAGGSIEESNQAASTNPLSLPDGRYTQGGFLYSRPTEVIGIFDLFETAGFGYAFDTDGGAAGLPPGPGSVILGSPFVRNNANTATYNPGGLATGFTQAIVGDPTAFNRPDQGIFIPDGSSMGTVRLHGVMHGSSDFTGALRTLNVGYLVGSVTVAGDLGSLVVASDAGQWVADPDFTTNDFTLLEIVKTQSELIVGRTVGEIMIGGRSLLEVTVFGDLSSPATRPPLDVLRYQEKEFIYAVDENAQFREQQYYNLWIESTGTGANQIAGRALLFGTQMIRNDNILNAEWVNSQSTSVIISGEVGGGNPAIDRAEDPSDVFAFAATRSQPVEVQTSGTVSVRIVDQDGRTLAATEAARTVQNSQVLRFTAPMDAVYYLIVSEFTSVDGDFDGSVVGYEISLNGIAPTTLGSYRTGAGTGGLLGSTANSIQVLGGSIGMIRVGTGFMTGGGEDSNPTEIFNTSQAVLDTNMRFAAGSISTPGHLYSIVTGGDIEASLQRGITINIGGNLGYLTTGRSELIGTGPLQGDVGFLTMRVGGSVGMLDIKGAVGIDQDAGPNSFFAQGLDLVTGLSGTGGDIGMIRIGSHVAGGTLNVTTPDGAVIGGILISQDNEGTDGQLRGIYGGTPLFTSRMISRGIGGDVRFVNFPRIDLPNGVNSQIDLFEGTTVEITDDSGGRVRITVSGVPSGAPVGFIRFLPINGSEGVAISTIAANLAGGRSLNIVSVGVTGQAGPIAIGSIDITNSTPLSNINISGPLEVDIWRIRDSGGGLNIISNTTPNGDIVAIDVSSLNTLTIQTGDLGRTQVPAFGPRLIGPVLGLEAGLNNEVGGVLGISAGAMDQNWNGQLYRPANEATDDPGTAYLDDIGGPFDDRLDGLVVRNGNVLDISVGGSIGDVILQGPGSILQSLRANADNVTPLGRFDGIVGVIYAPIIAFVDVGNGLAARDQSPIATTGIFAEDEIRNVIGRNGANIRSVIASANTVPGQLNEFGGIDSVNLTGGGDFIDAHITVAQLDAFWTSFYYDDAPIVAGDINSVTGTNADFFRSTILATNINTFRLTGGFFDASFYNAIRRAGVIEAAGYRNSTRTGTNLEFRENSIYIGENLNRIQTLGNQGEMSDLLVDIVGTVTGSISAHNFTRVDFQVNNEIRVLTATGSFRGSNITTGQLTAMTVGRSIAASSFNVAGPIISVTAGTSIINTDFASTGPNGRIDLIRAAQLISGSVRSSGPVATITTTVGDIDLDIRTTTSRGTVSLLSAARDLKLRTDISAGVRAMVAGRHIGDRDTGGIVLIRGDLTAISVPNGQLYSEIRVGGTVGVNIVTPGGGGSSGGAGSSVQPGVVIGRATHLANNNTLGRGSIVAFDRIGPVTVNGDFAGSVISYSNGIASVTINDGSLLPNSTIAAYDGTLTSLVINRGHLLGDVHADYDITTLRVAGSADGVFGHVGINPALSPLTAVDGFRAQLPLGVGVSAGIDGPRISAGRNLVSFVVTNGSVFEAGVSAGRQISAITIGGSVANDGLTTGKGSFFVAGDRIVNISIAGHVVGALFGAGFFDLGDDNRPGGVNAGGVFNADTIRPGIVDLISIGGNASDVDVVAGKLAGIDGIWNTNDDRLAIGFSTISNVTVGGTATNVVVGADTLAPAVLNNPKLVVRPGGIVESFAGDPTIVTGTPEGVLVPGTLTVSHAGANITFTLAGPGQAFWNAAAGRLTLADTTLLSTLTVTSSTGVATNLDIVSTNNSSIGTLNMTADLAGDSDIIIDDAGGSIVFRNVTGTGTIRFGGNVTSMSFQSLTGGFVHARDIGTVAIAGNFGATNPAIRGKAAVNMRNGGTFTVGGAMRALLNVERDLTSARVTGAVDNALIRVGSRLGIAQPAGSTGGTGALVVGSFRQSRVSVGDELGNVVVQGEMFRTAILIGGDLGADGDIGGTGLSADRVSSGFASNFTINGNFFESDIVAGALRGVDAFFGTSDDRIADGRSRIGNIVITGTGVGSNRFTEAYRIFSTGTLGNVTIGGQQGQDIGNFRIVRATTVPAPISVTDLRVTESSRIYTARIFFNQAIDASTLPAALTVREVRGSSGDVEIFLVRDLDYTLTYDATSNSAAITFNRDITNRSLPQLPGVPGPGIYRFVLDADVLRAQLSGARLDGNGDGFADPGDYFSQDNIVGDAGDKLASGSINVVNNFGNVVHRVDFYQPIDLDIVMDNNYAPNRLPDVNKPFTVRGVIGDHPDNNVNFFRFAGDMDVYKITLQAGQILRLGPLSGSAINTQVTLITPSGTGVGFFANTPEIVTLPVNVLTPTQLNSEQVYLVRVTGTYFIAVGNTVESIAQANIPSVTTTPGTIGDYAFTVEVFDDGNSGFADSTDAGNGERLIDAPLPSAFPANSNVLNIGNYTFTLNVGPDGIRNTADDIVTGGNGAGVTSVRANGVVTTTVESAIGPKGHSGVPGAVFADVDIFHLNNGNPIAPGTMMQITVKLTDVGGDLGSRGSNLGSDSLFSFQDFTGGVQFALFDTTFATAVDDAVLVFAPTDFAPNGGRPGIIADDGQTAYGYDANGDFFIRFPAPGRIGTVGQVSASYAVYIQGVFNTDYAIEIITGGMGAVTQAPQNIFIETRGGQINWLEAGGQTTDLRGFDLSVLNFTGTTLNGQTVNDYVLQRIVINVRNIYASLGVQVNISTDPSVFEFQDFSTVFLSSTNDPISQIFGTFNFFNFAAQGGLFSTITQPFGFAQRSDPLNADRNDEAVVFLPAFANLNYTPSQTDVDNLVQSLTAAVGRHVGELMGLRITGNAGFGAVDLFAANSVSNVPGAGTYFIPTIDRALSNNFDSVNDTDFWLGRQNSGGLLRKVLN